MPFRDAWLLVGAVLALLGFAVAEPVMSAVGFVVIVIGAIARTWSKYLFHRVTFTPELAESRAFIDEPVAMTITLENRKLLPLPWYEWRLAMADPFTVDGESMSAAAVPGLSWPPTRCACRPGTRPSACCPAAKSAASRCAGCC